MREGLQPIISVICPIYNAQRYLPELLLSILDQTFQNFECLLVNDGSSDHSEMIIQPYLSDERFKLLKQNHLGAPAARNMGIRYARGEYLYFCDADDLLDKNCLAVLLAAASENNMEVVSAGIAALEKPQKSLKERIKKVVGKLEHNEKGWFDSPIPGGKLYRREFVLKYELQFAPLRLSQDLQFYLEALICAEKSSFIDEVVYYHRTDVAGSISTSFDNRIMDIGKCFAIVQSRMDQMEKRQTMEKLLRTLQLRHLMYQWERISSVNFADQQMIAQWLCQKIYETMKQGVIWQDCYLHFGVYLFNMILHRR